jgi:hypothetical protein
VFEEGRKKRKKKYIKHDPNAPIDKKDMTVTSDEDI